MENQPQRGGSPPRVTYAKNLGDIVMIKRLIFTVSVALLAGLSFTSCESCPFGYSADDGGVSCCCTDKGNDCAGGCGCACDRCPT